MGIYKLVGGPRDGCMYEIPDNRTYWQVQIPQPIGPCIVPHLGETMLSDEHVLVAGYTRTVIHFQDENPLNPSDKIVCYRFDRFTAVRCFEHMIETWNPLPVNHNLHHALKAFAAAAGHGDEEHREWLAQAAEDFINNRPIGQPTAGMDPQEMEEHLRWQAYVLTDAINAMRHIITETAGASQQTAAAVIANTKRIAQQAFERMHEAIEKAATPETPNPEDDNDE